MEGIKKKLLFTIAEAASFCDGTVVGNPDEPITNVVIDSRVASNGALFVALKGEKTDGVNFIDSAIENGASCVLSPIPPKSGNAIIVPDTLSALMKLAAAYRDKMNPITIAVTGSVGKTTTKEFVASAVSMKYKTQKTIGNYNSTIGLPLTLFELDEDTEALVLEMGMSGFGEIEAMSAAARPGVAIITNIGSSHMEQLGSRENILDAKMEITKGLSKNGILILNGDDRLLWGKRDEKSDYFKKYVSIYNPESDYLAQNINIENGSITFDIYEKETGIVDSNIKVPAVGMHNVYNAMVSYVCAKYLDISDEDIKNGILNYKPTGMRQNTYKHGEYTIIEDCYNAAPESMKASLDVLSQTARFAGGKTHAVLGDMKELGAGSDLLHAEVGKYVTERGISYLYTVGDSASKIAFGALSAGMPASRIFIFKGEGAKKEAAEKIKENINPKDVVLFKASRAMALEDCVEYFKK